MSRWSDLATWRGPTVNQTHGKFECRGLVVHIAQGSYLGTIAWQKNPMASVSSHFVVDQSGALAQVVDTDDTAWTQADGNGHWLSVECAGFVPSALTAQQVESVAQLLARGHQQYGYPLQLATSPTGRGLGHHSMGGQAWGGHLDCPGPNIIAQKPAILARAQQIAGTTPKPTPPMHEEDSMIVFAKDQAGNVYRCDGIRCIPVPADEVVNQTYLYAGLGPWGAFAGRAVGPVSAGATGTPASHLKLYDMGFFGVVDHGPDPGPADLAAHHHDGGATGPAVAD